MIGRGTDSFTEWANEVFRAAEKFKKVMLKKKLTRAKTPCPLCDAKGMLHGRISGRKNHFSMRCDNCTAWMME